MKYLLEIKNKIITLNEAVIQCRMWHSSGLKVVFTNGCFDLIHLGHIDYLSKAAHLGDKLVIGLNTDESVSRIKGKNRPISKQESRAMVLAAMSFVSIIVLFNDETPYNLIKTLQPDVLVKGADYKPEEIVGYDLVMANGGSVETLDYVPGYSTSAIEKRIVESYRSQS